MTQKFLVPKFITIEDKLMGLLTFKQLFALLGAFLVTYISFRINFLLGVVVLIVSFASAILFTFVKVNGKLFIYVFPKFVEFIFTSKRFIWRKIEKISYKEIPDLGKLKTKLPLSPLKPKKTKVVLSELIIDPEKDLRISLEKPLSQQVEEINKLHQHQINPNNPYRLFPYFKFYKIFK